MIRKTLSKLAAGLDLTEGEMIESMNAILGGEATSAQMGAFLMALRQKGVTVPELTGAARVLRAMSTPIRGGSSVSLDRDEINVEEETILDTAGTGGSGTSTFNVSTTTAFIVAACGVKVAKHGTRAVSSLCGSADVLEALGVDVDLPASAVEDCLEHLGVGFLYAPLLHSAMRHVAGPRKEIGFRTIFNLLGPLTNPAGARRQVLGVHERNLARVLAETLRNLGTERAMVVHGEDGMDEITVCGRTFVTELNGTELNEYEIAPEAYGFAQAEPSSIRGGDARENAAIVRRVLSGEPGPCRDVVLLNASASLYVAGVASDLHEGIHRAAGAVDSGAALGKLEALIARTRALGDRWYRSL